MIRCPRTDSEIRELQELTETAHKEHPRPHRVRVTAPLPAWFGRAADIPFANVDTLRAHVSLGSSFGQPDRFEPALAKMKTLSSGFASPIGDYTPHVHSGFRPDAHP
jgi:hypothetical protein